MGKQGDIIVIGNTLRLADCDLLHEFKTFGCAIGIVIELVVVKTYDEFHRHERTELVFKPRVKSNDFRVFREEVHHLYRRLDMHEMIAEEDHHRET